MLTKKQILILFLLTAAPFAWYFLRPDIILFDGYHYLNLLAGKYKMSCEMPFVLLITFIPNNIFFVKLVLFALAFFSVLLTALGAGVIYKKDGWKAGILLFLNLGFIFEICKFENDQFAYPFLFLAFFFAMKYITDKKIIWQVAILGAFFGALGFWPGTIFFLWVLALLPGAWVLRVVSLITLIRGQELVNYLFGYGVLENIPLLALPWIFLALAIGIPGIVFRCRELIAPTFLAVFFVLLGAKWVIFSVPFLAFGCFLVMKENKNLGKYILTLAVCFALLGGVMLLFQPPTQDAHRAIEYAIDYSKKIGENGLVGNDWSLGHIVVWHGGNTYNRALPTLISSRVRVIIASEEKIACTKLKTFGEYAVYDCGQVEK